jgi:undecaprenyl diphosphate synthase
MAGKNGGAFPEHVAIIMDGNRRYARARLLPAKAGHAAGAQNLRKIASAMNGMGFKSLTVFAFAVKNWQRDNAEVNDLFALFKDYIAQYLADGTKNNIVIKFIGDTAKLDGGIKADMDKLWGITKNNSGMRLNIAVNYGGRDEIARAAKSIARDCAAGRLNPESVTEECLSAYLDTAGLPEPDLLIRTGGELRLSDFLIWQCADAELYFTEKLWPEFSEKDILEAVDVYGKRERKFGK